MEERRITEQEFDEAVVQAMQNIANNPRLEGMASLVVPLTGMAFASEMKKILFKKEATNE